MRPALLATSTLLWLCATSPAAAADIEEPIDTGVLSEAEAGDMEQTTGFIVDRTVTNFGAQFVRHFAQAWRSQEGVEAFDLTIVEKPSARWGSTVFVEYNHRPIARVFLQAASSASIAPLAQNAARHVAGRLSDNALLGLLTHDPDLGREELR